MKKITISFVITEKEYFENLQDNEMFLREIAEDIEDYYGAAAKVEVDDVV